MSEHLTALDATFLELEEVDPSAHMHIGAILVFEAGSRGRPPSLTAVMQHVDERLAALPRYRQRLSERRTGGLRWPDWQPDPGFRIEDHIRRAALPEPGGERELLAWAGDFWSQRLDRSRPLWEVVVLEGLEDGRWALATKTHHALVDGVGSVGVGQLLLDTSRRGSEWTAPIPPEALESGRRLAGIPAALLRGAREAVDVAAHPGRVPGVLEDARAMLGLLVRDELVAAPRTSLNVPIGTARRFEVVRMSLGEVKAIKDELGGTVNDVVLSAVTSGLRRLLLARGEALPDAGLRAMVPVNVRPAGDGLRLGNQITSLFVHLPVAEPDPLRRYTLTMREAETLKSGSQAKGGAALIALTGLAPPILHSVLAQSLFASRLFNVTITNVPGPQQPLYGFGARLEEVLPLVPLAADHAVGVAVVSYAGQVVFGLNADCGAAPDLHVLREGIESSFDELRELAGDRRRPLPSAGRSSGAGAHTR